MTHIIRKHSAIYIHAYYRRKRLGLPEDELVSTKSFMAKQRKFEKVNERLTLKLRASEEMRLQLKLEKNDLK